MREQCQSHINRAAASYQPRVLYRPDNVPYAREAIPLQVVVIGDLLARADGSPREDAHPRLAAHNPLLSFAVGVAGVVDEPRQAALDCSIDDQAPAERTQAWVQASCVDKYC